MKVATAQYTGRSRSHNRTGPSGNEYRFTRTVDGEPRAVAISTVEDAERFETLGVFDVEWTAQGKLARMAGDSVQEAGSLLKDLSYREKQRLTSALNLEVKGNAPEEELTEALAPAVEEMTDSIEQP